MKPLTRPPIAHPTARARPALAGRSQTRPALFIQTPARGSSGSAAADAAGVRRLVATSAAARSNSQTRERSRPRLAAGDRGGLPPHDSDLGRRTFLGFGAFLGGALAYGVHDRFDRSERHAEPYSGEVTLKLVTVDRAAQHPENAEPSAAAGREEYTVALGAWETIGGKRFRQVRGLTRIT